jgi:8-oxo-dGTP pyrophosphatase MutT (NUDIX family)
MSPRPSHCLASPQGGRRRKSGQRGPTVGETAEAAAVRETLEETGLAVIAFGVIGEQVHPATV